MYDPKDPKRNELKERLGPGFWIDQNDHLHISLKEMCEAVGLEPTEENIEIARQATLEMIKKQQPKSQIVNRRTKQE